MPLQPKDILLAFKHIALSDQLNRTEKQFAAFITDCYNRKTGRCDPSEETAAHTLRLHKRTIIRAGNRLVTQKLFIKRKHGGHNHCNQYEPNWEMFRELERQYKQRRKDWSKRFERSKLSPSESQPCHSRDDKPVTQTSPNNNIQSTYVVAAAADCANRRRRGSEEVGPRNNAKTSFGIDNMLSRYLGSPSSRQAAETSAERSWNNALIDRFGTGPVYAVIVEALDVTLQNAATKAEMARRGAGILCILEEMARRGIRLK